jgi:hypothetical protein
VQLKERNEVSKTMKYDRFTITTKELAFMKLNKKIHTYELENGYKPYLFMNEDTIDELVNIIGLSCDGLTGVQSNGLCGTYCGMKTFCDNTMQFGEVEMR